MKFFEENEMIIFKLLSFFLRSFYCPASGVCTGLEIYNLNWRLYDQMKYAFKHAID